MSANPAGRLTIDAPTRVFHWLFAGCFAGAYITGDSERWRAVHLALGYMVMALLGFRVLYGLAGPRHARLAVLARKVKGWRSWLKSLHWSSLANARTWSEAQNMTLASITALMLGLIAPLLLSGYLCDKACDAPLGGDALAALHEFFSNGFLMLVILHLATLSAISLIRRRNLARPMLTGRSPGTGPDPVRYNHLWLAATLLVCVLAYGVWEWRQALG